MARNAGHGGQSNPRRRRARTAVAGRAERARLLAPRHPWSTATYLAIGLVTYLVASRFHIFERFAAWTQAHERLQVDELLFVLMALVGWGVYRKQRHVHRVMARLQRQAVTDSLTGLPTRTLLLDRVDRAAARARRGLSNSALIFIDLDDFKVVNDRFGHEMGDRVLREVAERLTGAVRAVDTVARVGGDEFVVLCDGVAGEAQVRQVVERITVHLTAPFAPDARRIRVGASCGLTMIVASDDVPEATELVRRADMSMYREKDKKRARAA